MKPLVFALILGATFSLSPRSEAQEKSFDPLGETAESSLPRNVRTQVEYIEMSHEQMTALMADPKASKSDTALRQLVSTLIKEKKAEIIETQMVISRSGEKSTSESIHEFIYPTEFEPAQQVTTVKIEGETEEKRTVTNLATGPTPTAFETRNLGATLEIEPTIGENNQYIDLRIAPEIVYHTGNTKWATWKSAEGESDVQMPDIYTLRVTTAAALANNQPCLLAALSPKNDKGDADFSRKVLVFVRCNIIFIGR